MDAGVLESVLKRDRLILTVALVVLTALAWAYLMGPPAAMPAQAGSSVAGMDMGPALHSWTPTDLFFTFAMWAVMMVGMMTPSASPMILLYARVARQASVLGRPFAAAGWFACGYLLAWTGFAAMASLGQAIMVNAALMTPMLKLISNVAGGTVLIAAGLYQFSAVKYSCLSQCQSPLQFLQRHGGFRGNSMGSLQLGLRHGLYCIGCCWVLMALLFVGGVMNIVWIALLSVVVLLEKVLPARRLFPQAVGLVLVAAGLIFLYRTQM